MRTEPTQLSHTVLGEDEHRFELVADADLVYFDGHFEGEPVLPAVVQLDVFVVPRAQKLWPGLGELRGASRVKFKRTIPPGTRLTIDLLREAEKVRFRLADGAERVAEGFLHFSEVGS